MYEIYKQLTSDGKNYDNLSGTEVTHNKSTDQYNISIHVKNTPIDKENRIRGNSQYKENQWDVQIPSIVFNEKNVVKKTITGKEFITFKYKSLNILHAGSIDILTSLKVST